MNSHNRLKEERERLSYSQTAFAAVADASKHSQINWEKGVASPNAVALAAWAAIGLDVLYVVTGDRGNPAAKPLPADEQMWLDCYREWDAPIKKRELRRAMGISADGNESNATAPTVTSAAASHRNDMSGMTIKNTADGAVQVGYAAGKVSVKKGR